MDAVTMRLGDFSFQEKLVKGAPADWVCTLDCWVEFNDDNIAYNGHIHTPERAVFIVKLCPDETGGLPA